MAHASLTFWGPVIILDHQETQDVTGVAMTVADIVNRIGNALSKGELAIVGFALQAIAAGIAVNAWLVEQVDRGNGVYITSPWVAIGTIIPTTYPADIGLPAEWTTRSSGELRTNDRADLIRYDITPNAVANDIVDFRLVAFPSTSHMWRKVLVLRDGQGGQWDISVDPSQGTTAQSNALWADQVKNGQVLSLWKAKEFGIMTWVLDIGTLDGLPAGSRLTLEWIKDR